MRSSPDPRRSAGLRRSGSKHSAARRGLVALWLVVVATTWGSIAAAQAVELDTRVSFFHEPAKGSQMTVYTPSTDLTARPWDFLAVSGGWEADIVSGASEKLKTGPLSRANPDTIRGRLSPVIVYDPVVGRQYFGRMMRDEIWLHRRGRVRCRAGGEAEREDDGRR